MGKVDAIKVVLDELEKRTNFLLFKKNMKHQWLMRTTDRYFRSAFSIISYDKFNPAGKDSGFTLEPYVFVNNSLVEKYYLQVTTRIGVQNLDMRTLGNSVAALINNPSGEYLVASKYLDIFFSNDRKDIIIDQLDGLMSNVAVPFFDKYANWEGLSHALNSNPEVCNVNYSLTAEKCLKGIIVARLMRSPEFDIIFERNKSVIFNYGTEADLTEFRRLEDILIKIPSLSDL